MALKAIDLPDSKAGVNAKFIADIIGDSTVAEADIRTAWAEIDPRFAEGKPAGQAARVRAGIKALEAAGAIKRGKDGSITMKARVCGPHISAILSSLE